ncbi:MAG: UvrD-helicase domain-containing protein [Puniceicoccales bacterium]|jgi:ATP-dependent exoDNAse (exonuclease V) beta subunit|nr:UvrD-helicase domain-containing protein [Puniceicoccales bacterium]
MQTCLCPDEAARFDFCQKIDQNFSVIAPAGVGKTYSIVGRIQCIAQKKPTFLKNLHVVTYTKKAAEALRNRTLEILNNSNDFQYIRSLFNQSFFGTIHGLCLYYIQKFKTLTALPNHWTINENDEKLRFDFLRELNATISLKCEIGRDVLRHIEIEQLVHLAAEFSDFEALPPCPALPYPKISVEKILNYIPNARNQATVANYQAIAKQWNEDKNQSNHFLAIPKCDQGGEVFKTLFNETFQPLENWLSIHAFDCVAELSQHYFNFRIQKGQLKHEDLVQLFRTLLNGIQVQNYFKTHPIRLLLDEAQDTDAQQFQLILSLLNLNPQNQFSMVGDPQQSIYGSRTNVQNYLQIHKKLVQENFLKPLVFNKTFRCPVAIVTYLNKTFPSILNAKKDSLQVDFVPLEVSNKQNIGVFEILDLADTTSDNAVEHECTCLSHHLKSLIVQQSTLPSNICILCPRNAWLQEIQKYFNLTHLPIQIHSSKQIWREQALYVWLTACVHMIAYPEDSFEIVGFLRACLQIEEQTITSFVKQGKEIQILEPISGKDEISSALHHLYTLRAAIIQKNLYAGAYMLVQESIRWNAVENLDKPNEQTSDYIKLFFQQTALECAEQCASWFDFARRLKENLNTPFDYPQMIDKNAIQAYSCHKAKGLEWPIIVVPFLHRPIYPKPIHYPYILNRRVIWNAHSPYAQNKELERKRELERLLYVTCTRASQHLVLVNDEKLWGKTHTLTLINR